MKRKLFSAALSAFALLLLMGAAAAPAPAYALLAEEESAVYEETALETEASLFGESAAPADDMVSAGEAVQDEIPSWIPPEMLPEITPEAPEEVLGDAGLLINGQPAPLSVSRREQEGITYVSLAVTAVQLEPAAAVQWDGETNTVSVTTERLSLTAKVGQLYVVANGRYLYVPEGVLLTEEGQVHIPLETAAKVFDAAVDYNGETGVFSVTSGSGAIQSGEEYYNPDDLFWLSRVIYRESGNQSLEGQMAVGNVVLNRVADPAFPDTVEEVLAQKNQFSTYKSGVLRKTDPSESSIIAAKLVMDGGVVEETLGALFFDSGVNSWASRNKQHIATFGDHNFYG